MDSPLERLRHELEDAIGSAGPSALAQAPEGKWNAAQILEHLFLTYKNTNRAMAKCVEQGAPLATRATVTQRVAAFLVVNLGYLPEGREAPERVTPRGMPLEEVKRALVPELQKMGAGLDDCERRFGPQTKIMDHPFLGPLTAGEWRKFHCVHGRHHARQIRQRMGKS
ncbi:MAG: DinB family protein [Acidobacteriia bacterium]|nr:DinB family protein [Terriglobia bacterium]